MMCAVFIASPMSGLKLVATADVALASDRNGTASGRPENSWPIWRLRPVCALA